MVGCSLFFCLRCRAKQFTWRSISETIISYGNIKMVNIYAMENAIFSLASLSRSLFLIVHRQATVNFFPSLALMMLFLIHIIRQPLEFCSLDVICRRNTISQLNFVQEKKHISPKPKLNDIKISNVRLKHTHKKTGDDAKAQPQCHIAHDFATPSCLVPVLCAANYGRRQKYLNFNKSIQMFN